MKKRVFLLPIVAWLLLVASVCFGQGVVSTYVTMPGGEAPLHMTIDTAGNIYYACADCNMIKKIDRSGIITVVAGTGVAGYSGNGGPATNAQLHGNTGMCVDAEGNIIFSDDANNVIRKVNTSTGIIAKIAGINGLSWAGGDGGPASSASIETVYGVARDFKGNIYLADNSASVIRKIDTAGIISTIAGFPSLDVGGFDGDGGPATAASLLYPSTLCVDPLGNLYVGDFGNSRLRKIDTAGVITTVAGNGTTGYSGDGGAATAASISEAFHILADSSGNVYITDGSDLSVPVSGIRKINAAGNISTIAGNYSRGFSGDGGPATLASFSSPYAAVLYRYRDLYVSDVNNYVIRKISLTPDFIADSFSIFKSGTCSGITLSTLTTSPLASAVIAYFGDGTADTSSLLPASPQSYVSVSHSYASAGTYTIKELLMNGAAVLDSIDFSYNYLLCRTFDVRFYLDANSNCSKDSTELYNYFPLLVEIDSNSVPVDTLSATSGIYYNAYGIPGDVYNFRVLSGPPGLMFTCAGSGIITDSISSLSYNITTKYLGFNCSAASGFDLALNTSAIAGAHVASGTILVTNSYCTAEDAVVTMNINPKYVFDGSVPSPATVVGNTVTWNLSALSAASGSRTISYSLTVPGASLTPGDTILSAYSVTPISGDADATNNNVTRIDTVRSSYDPNEMLAVPGGYILPGTTLQYTISFENTGNDTAHNIALMDTLSDNVDIKSLRIDAATAVMNTAVYNAGGHNIVKFDFPRIDLLDSSHHNECTGMLIFHIKTKGGLTDGTTIFNHAGIFFDDNAVVMTDTVENVITLIYGANSVCAGSKFNFTQVPSGGVWTVSNGTASMSADTVIGVSPGSDTLTYTTSTKYGTGSVTKIVSVNSLPATILGSHSVCAGSSALLSDASIGGSWSSSSVAIASIGTGGLVTGLAAGTTVISYILPTGCYVAATNTVNPVPSAIPDPGLLCVGTSSSLSSAPAGGTWLSDAPASAAIGADGTVGGISAGTANISYTLATGCSASLVVSVTSTPGFISGVSALCVGDNTSLSDIAFEGTWSSSTPGIATVATIGASSGIVIGIAPGVDTISYIVSAGCVAHALVTVYALPLVVASANAAGCSSSIDLSASGAGAYVWLPATGLSCTTCASNVVNPVVTTTYTVVGTGAFGCSSSASVTLNANRILGHVVAGGSSADTVRVWLMQVNPADTSLIAMDSMCACSDGSTPYYEFNGVAAGTYLVRTKISGGVPGITGYVPTYSSSTPYWDTAVSITHTNATDTQHITMIHGVVPAGTGSISGLIISGTSGGAPAAGMLVYLLSSSGQVVTYTYTRADGTYAFIGLANGSYIIYPEEFKYYTTASDAVLLASGSETITDINFRQHLSLGTITPYSSLKVNSQVNENSIGIYPNPASGLLDVQWAQQVIGTADVTITDLAGRVVYKAEMDMAVSSAKAQLDISTLNDGVYIVTIRTGNISFNSKLVVQ